MGQFSQGDPQTGLQCVLRNHTGCVTQPTVKRAQNLGELVASGMRDGTS
jgi:hypothetical protein